MPTESKTNYITTIFGADIQDLRAGVRSVKQELKEVDREFAKTTATMGDWKKSADGLGAKLDSLRQKISLHEKIIAGYNAEIEKLSKNKEKNATKIEQLKTALDKEYLALNKNYKSLNYYQNKLKQVNSQTDTLATKAEKASQSVTTLDKGFTVLKGTLANLASNVILNVIRKIGELVTQVIRLGIEFDSAFTDVQKTVEATNGEFIALENTIRRMAMEMPQSASNIAEIASIAGQLGIEVNSIEEFTRVMVMLGDTTNMVAEEASDMFARFTNITGTVGDEYEKLASVIVDLGNNFATTESELLDMGQRLAGTATVAGLTETEILALASAMSSVGIQAELGGTAMSRIISKMQTEVETTGEYLDTFAEITGHTRDEFVKLFKGDPYQAIQDFIKGLADMADSGDSAIVALNELGINETRMRDTILRLTSAYELLDESMTRADKAWKDGTALAVEAGLRYDTVTSKVQILKNTWAEVGLEIYDNVEPALRALIDEGINLGRAFTSQETIGLNLEAKLRDLQTATINYKNAQEQAKIATDASTQAMLNQASQAQATAIYEFANAYTSAQNAQVRNAQEIKNQQALADEFAQNMENLASQIGLTRKEMQELYTSGKLSSWLSRNGISQSYLKDFEFYLKQEEYHLNLIESLNSGLEALQDSYDQTLASATQMAVDGSLDLDIIKNANRRLYNDVVDLIDAYESGKKSLDGIIIPEDQINSHIKVLEEQIKTVDDTTEAYWRLVGALSVLYGVQTSSGSGGAGGTTTNGADVQIRKQLRTDSSNQAQYDSAVGTEEVNAINNQLKLYQKALQDLISEGYDINNEIYSEILNQILVYQRQIENLQKEVEDTRPAHIVQAKENIRKISTQRYAMANTGSSEYDINVASLSSYESALSTYLSSGGAITDSYAQMMKNEIERLKSEINAVSPDDSWLSGLINMGGFTAEISEAIDTVSSKLEELENNFKTIYSGIFDIVSNIYEMQINEMDRMIEEQEKMLEEYLNVVEVQTNESMALLNARYNNGAISEEEYYKGISKVQADSLKAQEVAEQNAEQKKQELLAKRDELARKQFEANKANEIANVWINLGSAIMKTYAQSGWIMGSIFSALLTAQAGAQTALIASQQYVPQLAKGGVVDSPTFAMIGEDGKEVVMPLENNTAWLRELATQLTNMMGEGMSVGVRDRKYDYSRQMNFTQVINSPKALTRKEIYSQTRELIKIANRR